MEAAKLQDKLNRTEEILNSTIEELENKEKIIKLLLEEGNEARRLLESEKDIVQRLEARLEMETMIKVNGIERLENMKKELESTKDENKTLNSKCNQYEALEICRINEIKNLKKKASTNR